MGSGGTASLGWWWSRKIMSPKLIRGKERCVVHGVGGGRDIQGVPTGHSLTQSEKFKYLGIVGEKNWYKMRLEKFFMIKSRFSLHNAKEKNIFFSRLKKGWAMNKLTIIFWLTKMVAVFSHTFIHSLSTKWVPSMYRYCIQCCNTQIKTDPALC